VRRFISPLSRCSGLVQLRTVVLGEAHEREYVGFGVDHHGGELGDLGPELVGDPAPFGARGLGIFLSECSGDQGGGDAPDLLAGIRQHVAHEVDAWRWLKNPGS
jgi:hypothetical protein